MIVQSLSHVRLFATPWTACSTLGFPVLHYLPELAQTQVHWVSDAIQPSHPLSPSSPPAFNLSQRQDLFQWVGLFTSDGQRIGALTPVLPMNTQDWFPLGLTGLSSLQFKGLSRVFSNTRKFFSTRLPWASQVMLVVKNPPANAGDTRDTGSIPGTGRYLAGGNGNPLQYSSLGNSRDREAWWSIAHRVTKSRTWLKQLSTHTQPSLWSSSHICTWLLEKPQIWLYGSLSAKWCLCFLIHCLGLL